jgi:acyl-CoA dehydrogenase
MSELPQERLLVGITAVAVMEAALRWTLDYTRDRKAFGRTVADFQNTRFRLAEVKTEVTVARTFLGDCIQKHMRRDLDVPTAAMCKWWLSELECRVVDTCLQFFGGYGYLYARISHRPRLRGRPRPPNLCRRQRGDEGDRRAQPVMPSRLRNNK